MADQNAASTSATGPMKTTQNCVPYQVEPKPLQKNVVFLDLEIDPEDLKNCTSFKMCDSCSDTDIELKSYTELPLFLRYNPNIKDGYLVNLSPTQCLRGIFLWTNDTVNVWSHLLAFVVFAVLMVLDNLLWIPAYSGDLSDHIVISACLLCFQVCTISSAAYHTFRCHSQRAFKRWLSLDQCGICVGMLGCYLPCVHLAFRCHERLRLGYLLLSCCMCQGVLFVTLCSRSASRAFRRLLVPMYCGMALCGVVPAAHWVMLYGLQSPMVSEFLGKLLVMYGIGAVAFGFYISKFPEVCCPGSCDFIGNSHNWWHLCAAVGMLWIHGCSLQFLDFFHRSGSRCSLDDSCC